MKKTRNTMLALAGTVAAVVGGSWWTHRPPPVSPLLQHAQAVVTAAQAVHHLVTGSFVPPKPGQALDTKMLEIESAGDRVYTLSAMWMSDSVSVYAALPAGPAKTAKAAEIRAALVRLRAETAIFPTDTSVVSGAATTLKTALDLVDKDIP